MRSLSILAATALPYVVLAGCAAFQGDAELPDQQEDDFAAIHSTACDPQMTVFPVGDAHNIGYDNSSCGTGTCEISCPDSHANSDWGGDHHGIDIFAYQRAPLVAVASGEVVAVGEVSSTSGIRVRLRDSCGWEYYYGHMDEAIVSVGQWLSAGDLLGYMGYTGTGSTHLHFNVSPDGSYYEDIDPFDLLYSTSATACGGEVEAPEEEWTEPEESETSGGGDSSSGSSDSGSSDSGSSDSGSSGGDSSGGDTSSSDWGCGAAGGTTIWYADESLASCDGRFTLYMQDDGNLVLYQNGVGALWNTGTQGYSGAYAMMQGDGNLVVYSSGGWPLWYTGTHGYSGAVLALQDDGNLVIYSGSSAVWNSGTCCH